MTPRDIAIKTILLVIGLISLIYAIYFKQWTYGKEILKKFVDFENGGLPTILFNSFVRG